MPFFVLELEKLIQRLEEEFNIRLGSEKNLVFFKTPLFDNTNSIVISIRAVMKL